MKKITPKIIVITFIIVVVLVLIFSGGRMKHVNNVNNTAITASALLSNDTGMVDEILQSEEITRTLRIGNRGIEVEKLQLFLNQNGYELGGVDGVFGLKTRRALKSFQEDNGQRSTGVFNEETKDFVNQMIIEQSLDKEEVMVDENLPTDDGLTNDADPTAQQEEEKRKQENEKLQAEAKKQEEENKQKQEEQKKIDEQKKIEEQKKKEEEEKNKEETIEFLKTKNKQPLFTDYSCKEENNEKLSVFTGEYIDESKNAIGRLSDVWSTTDGTNWKQESTDISIGEGWERMVVKIQENGVDTVYSFGGKYKSNGSNSDNGIYKSTDMVKWSYVGDIPEMNHEYDRSVVYFKDKFWLIGSQEGKNGVWSSSTGEKWTQVLTKTPWDGMGMDRLYNDKGRYDSNSLGAYVINDKMWYLVYNNQQNSGYPDYGIMRLYSTKDGENWTDEGYLKNKDDNSYFNIAANINPAPVTKDGKIWIVSYSRKNRQPIVINTSNGKDWYLVSTNQTNMTTNSKSYYIAHNYSSVAVFMNKLWVIGGWDVRGNSSANNNGDDIWASSDGVKWTNMVPKGVSFPGPADRWLSGVMAIGKSSPKASNLEIQKEYNATDFLTGKYETERTLGKWKMTANENKDSNGDVIISTVSFVGTDYKMSKGGQFSSLESLENITVYADNVKVGYIKSFKGPFFDSTGEYAIPQTITLDKNVTLKKGESVWFSLVADFPAPKYKNFEMRNWLAGVGFKDNYSTPCNVTTNDNGDGDYKFAGRNLYYKDR